MGTQTTGEIIFQTCTDLHNAGRLISRQVLAKVTKIEMGKIDDHVTRMVDSGRLRRVSSGILEIVEQFPPNRAISKTVLPDGRVTIEVGDDMLQLTPSEAQVVGASLLGEATQYAQLRGDRDVSDQVAKLNRQRDDDRRQIERLTETVARMRRQSEFAFES